MRHDALGVDGRSLRRSPWRVGAGIDFATAKRYGMLLVESVLLDMRAKRRLVGKLAGMAVEIAARPFGHGPADTPAHDKIVPAVPDRNHGERRFTDKRNGISVGAAAKTIPHITGGLVSYPGSGHAHAATLPSTVSAATASAVTSCRTAHG